MDTQAILDEMLALLDQKRISVRREAMNGAGGGLCRMKDRQLFFYDIDSSTFHNAVNCADAVRKIIDLETIYIRPQVREFIENNSNSD